MCLVSMKEEKMLLIMKYIVCFNLACNEDISLIKRVSFLLGRTVYLPPECLRVRFRLYKVVLRLGLVLGL